MKRPAPQALADIRHPGPRAPDRQPHVPCRADRSTVSLAAGSPLLAALGDWAERSGYSSAVLDLSELTLTAFDYVMPDRSIDDRHAAWYSETKVSSGARLTEAVAILGWRDGTWFAHIHAYWHENGSDHLGHLLPRTLAVESDAQINGYGIKNARFEADLDPETEFTLFRIKADETASAADENNAFITTLAPFEDLHASIVGLAKKLPGKTIDIQGLGSLAGAEFRTDPPMTGLISEILVQPDTSYKKDQDLALPVRCVDLDGNLFDGLIAPDACPTLITCELLLVSKPD